MDINWATLKFSGEDSKLEEPFLSEYNQLSLPQVRLTLIMALILFTVFGLLDVLTLPEQKMVLGFIHIRFFAVLPFILLTFLLTFWKSFQRYMQPLLALSAILVVGSIMSVIAFSTERVHYFYYIGLIFMIMGTFTLGRMRFMWATFFGWFLLVLYEIVAIWINPAPIGMLLRNNLFFITANVMGMMACYYMEFHARRNFFLRHQLETERKKEHQQAATALSETEKRYQLLAENTADLISTMDLNMNFTYVSPASMRLLGYTAEEAKSWKIEQVLTPESLRLGLEVLAEEIRLEESGTTDPDRTLTLELDEIRKDGTIIPVEVSLAGIRDKDRKLKEILMVTRDISERRKALEAIHIAEETYRNLFLNAQTGLFRADIRTGAILEANDALARFAGHQDRAELLSKPRTLDSNFVNRKDIETILAALKKQGYVENFESQFRRIDGAIVWMRYSARLNRDRGWLEGVVQDITKEKTAHEAIAVSEQRYKSVVENALEAILVIQDGQIKFVNSIASKAFGYSEEEFLALPVFDLVHPDDRDAVVKRYLKKMNGDAVPTVNTYRGISKDGNTKWIEISSVLMDWEGRPATLNLITDITERKKVDEQLQTTLDSLRKAVGTTIQVMVSAVETRDPYTAGHQLRSANLAYNIAAEMGLPEDTIEGILMAGSIHDIGKLSIPSEILTKPTKLLDIEFSLIKEHAEKGYEMLKNIESPWPLAEIVYQHHERMNGSGYPRKLKLEQILMEARILIVADVVEAMASHRPYRPALGIEKALEEIEKNRGTLYDADVADACLRLFREKGFNLEEVRTMEAV